MLKKITVVTVVALFVLTGVSYAGIGSTLKKKVSGAANKVANTTLGQLAGLTPVNIRLDEYLTGKALDGLFIKIAEQEKLIRTDPVARVTELLKRVFGANV